MWKFLNYRYRNILWLIGTDIAGLVVSFNVSRYWHIGELSGLNPALFLLVIPVTLFLLYVLEAYVLDTRNSGLRMTLKTGLGVVCATGVFAALAYATKAPDATSLFWRGTLLVGFAIFFVWATLSRALYGKAVLSNGARRVWTGVGNQTYLSALDQTLKNERSRDALNIYPCSPETGEEKAQLMQVASAMLNDRSGGIIVATDGPLPEEFVQKLMELRMKHGIKVYDLVDFYEQHLYKLPVLHVGTSWFALSQGFSLIHETIQHRVKRVVDLMLAVVLSVLMAPVALVAALIIKMETEGPVIYRQKRVGLDAKVFDLYKFRTMYVNAEAEGPEWTKENDPRITRVGKWLRLTRIDELPQIWNVIVNDMSFIGPRPERPEFVSWLEKEIPYYDLRCLVKPGITGWAQVMYPYGSSVEDSREKLQYDLFYIKNYSLILDGIIALKTLRLVLLGGGR